MSASILITYATRAGSTAEVAEAIGAELREAGLWPDLVPMRTVETLQGRDVVILGTPLYIGSFPAEFRKFAVRHREALANLHPWMFVLGPTRNEPADFEAARKQAEKQLERFPWLKVEELQIFGGRWSTENLPFPFSLARSLPALKNVPASDIRDWKAIDAWAQTVVQHIRTAA